MAAASLVEPFVEGGEKFLRRLDQAGVKVWSAFWCWLPEADDWRLHLAVTKVAEEGSRAAYLQLISVLRASESELAPLTANELTALDPRSELMRIHIGYFGVRPGFHRIYSRNKWFDGQPLPDALIYRLEPYPLDAGAIAQGEPAAS